MLILTKIMLNAIITTIPAYLNAQARLIATKTDIFLATKKEETAAFIVLARNQDLLRLSQLRELHYC
jgi:hypothetical protein